MCPDSYAQYHVHRPIKSVTHHWTDPTTPYSLPLTGSPLLWPHRTIKGEGGGTMSASDYSYITIFEGILLYAAEVREM